MRKWKTENEGFVSYLSYRCLKEMYKMTNDCTAFFKGSSTYNIFYYLSDVHKYILNTVHAEHIAEHVKINQPPADYPDQRSLKELLSVDCLQNTEMI